MSGLVDHPTEIDFYFDPICPWAFQTSLWIREVARQTGLSVQWKFFSLEEINRTEGKKHPWEREIAYGWTPMRIAAHLRRRSNVLCGEWYLRCATALHLEGRRPYERDVAVQLLADIGESPRAWDEALADPTTHDDVKRDHDHAATHLAAFGVPVLDGLGGRAVFGPVVVPAPVGEEALQLWNLTLEYSRFPGLYEIKTPKTDDDLRSIGEAFSPYLKNREWPTIQNPAR
jgi:2-hydroxychromene-2-carboxylate isomerase